MANYTNLYYDKSYNLSKLMFYPSNGRSVDLTYIMIQLSIYEDIYNNCVTGTLVVGDGADIITTAPVTGFDYLILSFDKPGDDTAQVNKTFRVYKVGKARIDFKSMNTQTYELHFCSEEMAISATNKVSKSYIGKLYSDIASDIFNTYLKTKKPVKIDPTQGIQSVVVSGWSPFYTLNWLADRSLPGTYVYYENLRDGFNFRSMEQLVKGNTIEKYRYFPKNINQPTETMDDDFKNVIQWQPMETADTLERINKGMYGSRLYTTDLVRQRIDKIDLKYTDYFGQISHTDEGGGAFDVQHKDRFDKTPSDNVLSYRAHHITTKDHDSDSYIKSHQPGVHPNNVENWLLQKASRLQQFQAFRSKIVVPGTIDVGVGSIIEFQVPMIRPTPDDSTRPNPLYAGRYLVTALRHNINYDHFETVMEIARDCTSTVNWPTAINNNDIRSA